MSDTKVAEPKAPADPMKPLPQRDWWHRHLEPEERRRVMNDLAITRQPYWAYRFTVMLTLSVVVAVMGLSLDSAAVVIGAMLLAPLMGPVLASAGCLSMALFRRAFFMFFKVALASAWAIGLAYLIAMLLPATDELPREVVARTAPDIRDLVVALGAGAAGAYATVRRDASAALPGVAVAVALVPPLGSVGIALEAGHTTFALGALLLYVTNLAAIILAGVVVFIVTGFVPHRRLSTTYGRLMLSTLVVVAVVVAITVPLYRASTNAVSATNDQIVAQEIVQSWLGATDTSSRPTVDFDNGRLLVSIRSFETPIDAQPLEDALRNAFGPSLAVSIEWDRVERATTTTTAAPTTTIQSDEERLLDTVRPLVDQWLADNSEDGRPDRLVIDGNLLRIDATGTGQAPSVGDLTTALDEVLDQTLEVRLTWLERQDLTATVPPPSQIDLDTQQMLVAANTWAAANEVTLRSLTYDGARVMIELAGLAEPAIDELVISLHEIIGAELPVDVMFSEQRLITTTTTQP